MSFAAEGSCEMVMLGVSEGLGEDISRGVFSRLLRPFNLNS